MSGVEPPLKLPADEVGVIVLELLWVTLYALGGAALLSLVLGEPAVAVAALPVFGLMTYLISRRTKRGKGAKGPP